MAIRVLVSDPLEKQGVEILEAEKEIKVDVKIKLPPEELKKIIKDYDAIVVRSETKVTKDIIQSAPKLKVIGRAGIGLDNVDVKVASQSGVIVMNSPTGNTISTAEHAFSLLLSLSRNIPQADASLKNGKWDRKKFTGVEVYGKTLGIIGLGRIGTEVAKRALSFKMKVMAYDPFLSKERAEELGVESVDLQALFKNADYITVHTPLTDETRNLINKDTIKFLKKSVRIINCARGGIVNENDICDAIQAGLVAGAAFDVYEKEPLSPDSKLTKSDRIITTPHLGASTEEAQINVAIDIANSVRDALLDRGIRNAVNVPSVDAEVLKVMKPYLDLAEKIGLIHAQLAAGAIKKVKITYVGEQLTCQDLTAVTLSMIKGLLSHALEEKVNFVNAMVIAKERGITIVERKTEKMEDFVTLIYVSVETDKGENIIMGTLFTKTEPRIVKINDFYVEAIPKGNMLVIHNDDAPGIIGHIGTLLGDAGINIAGMTFGRVKRGGEAITVLNVDQNIPKEIMEKIGKAKHIKDAKQIKL
ncbi:MAG: phosphoglycerate dehydrogenase [Candidatus Omnitrophica bacterium]|nr:phosphoglycerate dehydrogenase [Candidatus Omnitrophota bacterium]